MKVNLSKHQKNYILSVRSWRRGIWDRAKAFDQQPGLEPITADVALLTDDNQDIICLSGERACLKGI